MTKDGHTMCLTVSSGTTIEALKGLLVPGSDLHTCI
eukprot:CAMPEP_0181044420 /NCGR_PEP_ID=MMETSP1070-20121207/13256_1 /TAXON_ID=265543 /ORGANISM="Minutocellus polymorphus, Strain NH13" /LENGTH=35 /DNA_ID= /DNA_START= /DNA_END= /DNA_ORIENTATION=